MIKRKEGRRKRRVKMELRMGSKTNDKIIFLNRIMFMFNVLYKFHIYFIILYPYRTE